MKIAKMNNGFYPALGTPTGSNGNLIKNSFTREIDLMIDAGASGVLCMGSMGKMATIRSSEYRKIAKQCSLVVAQRVPLLVGVMDCSVLRISDRIDALDNINIDGVVATAPFYHKTNPAEIVNFFSLLAKTSKYPVYIYDLPSVTQSPVTTDIVKTLAGIPNIAGIKTANLQLILDFKQSNNLPGNFSIFYSNLDKFDVAIKTGIGKNLDGMFTCTPYNSKKIYKNIAAGDFETISSSLKNIIRLRDLFLKENILSAYSYAMELLGCPGNYQADYDLPVSEKLKEEIAVCMKVIKEI